MVYELHLFDIEGNKRPPEKFVAIDDDDALDIAHGVHTAISEQCQSYEVWNDARRIMDDGRQSFYRSITTEELINQRVANMLDLAERLALSHDSIARSQRLLKTIRELQAWRGRREPK